MRTNEALFHKDVWGSVGMANCITDLDTSWRRVVSLMHEPLYL
jgi:hypothetical protein